MFKNGNTIKKEKMKKNLLKWVKKNPGKTKDEAAKHFGVSWSTIHRYSQELEQENANERK